MFGIFNGWFSRKKGLIEKLDTAFKDKVLQVYDMLVRNYAAKVQFVENPARERFEDLKQVLRVEQTLAKEEESGIRKAITVIEGIVNKDIEQQVKQELALLLKNLISLERVLDEQHVLLNVQYNSFNLEAFRVSVEAESTYLAIEHGELERLQAEFKLMPSAKPEIITPVIRIQRYNELRSKGMYVNGYRELAALLVENWQLTQELERRIKPEHVYNLFRYGLPVVAGLVKTREDLRVVGLLLVELAGKINPKYVYSLFEFGLPAFTYLINTQDNLRAVLSFLADLIDKIKFQNVNALLQFGFSDIRNTVKNINELDKINGILPELLLKSHRLYIGQKKESFFKQEATIIRKRFRKFGSETILLGGKLVGKAIIRIVNEHAFLAWKKAFEAKETWEKAGFDYIPVEPILTKNEKLRAYKTKTGNYYRVYTKVLGMSLYDFIRISNDAALTEQLTNLRDRIKRVLTEDLQIMHGHLHDRNFCIEIQDDKIRLYAIDFDEAISL